MKILILSVTAGQGHHRAAKAISDCFENAGAETYIMDVYEYLSPFIKDAIDKGYLISTSKIPRTYGKAYRLAEKKSRKSLISYFLNSIFSGKFAKFLNEYGADAIICTHVWPANLISLMKKKNLIDTMALGIITDFTMHPYWEETEYIDYYVIPNELLIYQALKKGLPREKLLPFGIPINEKFSERIDKKQAKQELGINPEVPAILMMSGSMGYGNMAAVIKEISSMPEEFQILCVCGNNEKAYKKVERLKKSTPKEIYNFGFVNNVDIMMDASDCIFTKPGGLTSSEALAKELPMILIKPIPGQEERNTEFFLNNGAAMRVTKTFTAAQCLYELLTFPKRIEMLKECAKPIAKKNAAKNLCDFITDKIKQNDKENI